MDLKAEVAKFKSREAEYQKELEFYYQRSSLQESEIAEKRHEMTQMDDTNRLKFENLFAQLSDMKVVNIS